MKRTTSFALAMAISGLASLSTVGAQPALTIYNQNFAVVRDTVPLDLKAGVNDVHFADATAQLEPDSVILRDPNGKISLQILEQNYRNDPVSQGMMLSLFEGKTLDFAVHEPNKPDHVVQGKIIRSGYIPGGGQTQPIIEVDGKLQFELPGMPIFPALADNTILKPELNWEIDAAKPVKLDAEIAYVTNGMSWHADYNIVTPENSDTSDLIGWITIDNESGKVFENAKIKLMAGDVNRVQPMMLQERTKAFAMSAMVDAPAPVVSEKAFSEYHLYTLAHPTTLQDRETKQVEFTHATGIHSQRIYVYDGALDYGWQLGEFVGGNSDYGTQSNKKVNVFLEFKNSEENHLGIPLPKGRVRLYQQDSDKQLEFIGEDNIDHTPKDETIRLRVGNSFDLVGERKRTNFHVDSANHEADESFEIKVRNHKKEPVEIRVVEHLYRWNNWEITQKSDDFKKTDAQTIEFRVSLKPDEEKTVTYTVHYTW